MQAKIASKPVAATKVVPAPATPAPAASPATPKVAKAKGKVHVAYIAHMASNKVLDPNAKITVLVEKPKFVKPTRFERFALHRNGQTVAQYIDRVVAMGKGYTKANIEKDIQWDVFKGFVRLG